jgi:hypothetical protein
LALAVLVANDHWLKGSDLLPGWLTGKLSDFAGMFVAPVLLATLLRAQRPIARLASMAAVAAPFVAIKLSPGAARVVEELTRDVGLNWRIWSDPTDLLALALLPLVWQVLGRSAPPRSATSSRWLLERLGGIAATLACLATSTYVRQLFSALAIVNTTHEAVDLQVFRPAEPLDCDAIVVDPEGSLAANDFSFESCKKLESYELFPLDLDWSGEDDQGEQREPATEAKRVCDAVLLRADGLEDTVLFWNDVPKAKLHDAERLPADAAHLVYVEQIGKRLVIARPDVAQAWSASFSVPRVTCPGAAR